MRTDRGCVGLWCSDGRFRATLLRNRHKRFGETWQCCKYLWGFPKGTARPSPGSINPGEEKPSAIARMTKGRASFAQTDSVAALVTDQADAASDDG